LRRLDQEIVKRQLARSRGQAVELIEAGNVLLNGFVATKPTTQVNETCSISIKAPDQKYVSRAALKLLSALNVFQIDITGKNCVDAGASTGGFTQVLLERGANKVYAVDVGYGQLAWQLQQDSRVEVLDRTNIKNLSKKQITDKINLITADLSFISLKNVLPALDALLEATGEMILMVKPQFEVGKEHIGRGVVRSVELRKLAISGVIESALELGWVVVGAVESEVHGPSGNREFFLHLSQNGAQLDPADIFALITEE
jgi:23S rRNA (cytidine1920-2'-O)/16S rRNA (cytidine1409-2'-O)-methyltransferase